MTSPDAAPPIRLNQVVVRYRYQGRPWRLVFDLDAKDPVRSIYFDEEEMRAARRVIGERDEQRAPPGEPWEWPEQGVRNELDEDPLQAPVSAMSFETETGPGTVETVCWHHRTCLWSCMRST